MISDITLGQFFPGFSVVHKLDPRTKIILAIAYIVSVFLAKTPIAFLFLTLFTILLIPLTKINAKVILKGLKPMYFILIFTSLLHIFATQGNGEPLVEWRFIHIYYEGILRAIFMSLRFLLFIVGTSLFLTYTTSPIALTDGLEWLLSPLKLIKVPVHIFSMMMTIALRFIPTLVEETEKIMNAQSSRGADFASGNLIKRAKALIPLIIPLFASSFKRAGELASAMECRCYAVDRKRTKMVKLTFHLRDLIFVLLIGAIMSITLFLNHAKGFVPITGWFVDFLFYII